MIIKQTEFLGAASTQFKLLSLSSIVSCIITQATCILVVEMRALPLKLAPGQGSDGTGHVVRKPWGIPLESRKGVVGNLRGRWKEEKVGMSRHGYDHDRTNDDIDQTRPFLTSVMNVRHSEQC